MSRLPVVILGDFHAPFHCRKSTVEAIRIIKKLKPKIVIQIGDALDLYSFSRFPRSLNVMTPIQEIKQGVKALSDLWWSVRDVSKGVECWQIKGNHDMRLARQMMAALPETEGLVQDLWQFDGVTTMAAERNELILDGTVYMHGFRKHGDHVKWNLMSTVCGHSHVGGVIFVPHKNDVLFELNCGYLGNPKSAGLSYTQQARISRWTRGVGVIDDYGPRFISLE